MKVLGILGSPRRGGNTEILLDETLRGARDRGGSCEKLVLRDLKIAPCLEIYEWPRRLRRKRKLERR